jgi:Collagen triple helix repeat (20 copies)
MKKHLSQRGIRLLLATTVLLALAAGIAYASIPDSSGVIQACYQKVNGQLRVIDTSKGGTCNSSETALSWNQTGPIGAKGTTGAKGSTGANGINGQKGATGPPGANGTNGAKGATGPKGPAGGLDSVQVVSQNVAGTGGFVTLFVDCPAGTTLTGGGAQILGHVGDADGFGPRIISNNPFNKNQWIASAVAPTSWQAQGLNTEWALYGYALCASG